jgi:cell division ATPase FtsA
MTHIAEYVWNEIREAGFAKKLSAGIVLTGGTAALKNVGELFARVTGQETRVACAEIGVQTESLEKVSTPNLTLAVSLLQRGAKLGACPVGVFIPSAKPEPKPAPKAEPQPQSQPQPQPKAEPVQQPVEPIAAPQPQPAPAAPKVELEDDGDDIVDGTEDIVKPSGLSRIGSWFKRALSDAFPAPDDEDDGDDEY